MPGRPSVPLALLALGIVTGATLVWAVPLTGFVDGGLHLNGANVLRESVGGLEPPASLFLEWFAFPVPNLLPELALALATAVVSPEQGELAVIAAYVVTFPLSLLYAIRGVTRDADWLALFALPLTFTFSLHFGFYNFSFSVVLFLLVVGWALRLPARPSLARVAVLAGLLALTYLTHVVGFVEAVLAVAVIAAWRSLCREGRPRVGRSAPRWLAGTLALVALALAAGAGAASGYGDKPEAIVATLSLAWGLVTFSRAEVVLALVLALCLLALVVAVWRTRSPRVLGERDALLVYSALAFLAVALAPSGLESGAAYATQRLALFPALGLILWLAAQGLPRRALAGAGLTFLLVALALALVRLPAYREVARAVEDFMTASSCVAERATMVQATLHQPHLDHPSWRVDPLSDEAARVAASTGGLDLGNVEWAVPFYLLHFREGTNPYELLPSPPRAIEAIPPSFDLSGYQHSTGRSVDYVLVAGRERAATDVLASAAWQDLRRQLRESYRLVHRSPRGWVETWERRVPGLMAAGAAVRSRGRCVGIA